MAQSSQQSWNCADRDRLIVSGIGEEAIAIVQSDKILAHQPRAKVALKRSLRPFPWIAKTTATWRTAEKTITRNKCALNARFLTFAIDVKLAVGRVTATLHPWYRVNKSSPTETHQNIVERSQIVCQHLYLKFMPETPSKFSWTR